MFGGTVLLEVLWNNVSYAEGGFFSTYTRWIKKMHPNIDVPLSFRYTTPEYIRFPISITKLIRYIFPFCFSFVRLLRGNNCVGGGLA